MKNGNILTFSWFHLFYLWVRCLLMSSVCVHTFANIEWANLFACYVFGELGGNFSFIVRTVTHWQRFEKEFGICSKWQWDVVCISHRYPHSSHADWMCTYTAHFFPCTIQIMFNWTWLGAHWITSATPNSVYILFSCPKVCFRKCTKQATKKKKSRQKVSDGLILTMHTILPLTVNMTPSSR